MRLFEKIENKVIHNYIKSRNLIERFIKLQWYFKLLISPIALLFFFTIIFPVVIILGILYKVLLILSNTFKEIFSNHKLVIVSFIFFILSGAIILLASIILSLLLSVYVALIPSLPSLLLKFISIIIAPYLLLLFFIDSNSTLKNMKSSINTIIESDTNLNEDRSLIEETSNDKSSINPLVWIMKNPFTLMTGASLTFCGALFVVIISSVTINSSFPDIFFSNYENSINHIHFWFSYIFDQMLIIIPIDIMGPFIPDNSEELIKQPWGGLLSILFQIFLAYMTYLYISMIIGSAKYFILKKKTKNNLP